MGCAISGLGLAPKAARDAGDGAPAVARLSGEQVQRIKESWKVIQEDIARVGIIVFVRLFETHPECKDVFFLFRDVEDLERLRTSKELRAHGLRVMSFIEKSVARLDHMERLDQLALELGKSHYRYNALPKYYGYVGAEFICAVQPILKDNWTTELEEAWKSRRYRNTDSEVQQSCNKQKTLFLYVTTIMKQGYQEEEKNHTNNLLTSRREKPEKINTAV